MAPTARTVRTAHLDTFARDRLPAAADQPEFVFELPELQFPERLNCAVELLHQRVTQGWGARPCLIAADCQVWTYADLQREAGRIAQVLVQDMGLVPGNRVLLRGANSPLLAACCCSRCLWARPRCCCPGPRHRTCWMASPAMAPPCWLPRPPRAGRWPRGCA